MTTDDPASAGTTVDEPAPTTGAGSTSGSSGLPEPTTGGAAVATTGDTTAGGTTTDLEPGATTGGATTGAATTGGEPGSTTGGDDCPVDLTLSLALDLGQCNEALSVVATVHNVGSVDLPAGLEVTFYEGTDASGLKLTTELTKDPLPVNGSTEVAWFVLGPLPDDPRDYYAEITILECGAVVSDFVVDAACPD